MALSPLKPRPATPQQRALRAEVRDFLESERTAGTFVPQCDSWLRGFDRGFSRKLGARGWLGMTWPVSYGGGGRTPSERYVVLEELLAAGAPVAAHWFAERQVGPGILRHGTEQQKKELLPGIIRGETVFAIGYSEPDVGSDLASVRTRAERVPGGWRIRGTKVWTSHGHHADYLLVLCRTSSDESEKHQGLSQIIVPLPARGLRVRPILLMTGEHHFNEMVLEDVEVPESALLGAAGEGWQAVNADLAMERSGPERFMSTFPLLREMVRQARDGIDGGRDRVVLGELVSRLWALRSMSRGVAALIEGGQSPGLEAALVKDLGTRFEGEVGQAARQLHALEPSLDSPDDLANFVAQAVLQAPAFTLRGGTNEILRGIVARGLGMR